MGPVTVTQNVTLSDGTRVAIQGRATDAETVEFSAGPLTADEAEALGDADRAKVLRTMQSVSSMLEACTGGAQ